ncbi:MULTISPECIES: flagellar basal-body rod protein FlgF [Halanaerobium]|jgi:flagellar basal-body rod protein FlgG|uniref:Flagellar basal-body rod protein FlgG n=1 Tax=Halanaerobium kushneri TaxID=56779 RepID=A0A1N6UB44_9FIRM|nr:MULTISPECIES: flagellar basal-body rod protein FlgF [Halanaerobium]PUU89121.1 MAG: flagellar basal-body rod protein FlgG [Halanaerobium sp.]PUU94696.1 MAG: flagellar basal-body rod protein FlgG [Halanaerobium sp.]RCW60245.1 flagellar basal-body rod protein FlgG [Halanaerobium sp. ST460_2HS_T2]SIQ62496.1 flagellar basal-body rod protein FlgG [Halanaerobium kushneri]
MIRGLYTAASSMNVLEKKTNIRSNNLANVNTAGFKKSEAITASFPEMLLSRIENGKADKEIGELATGSYVEQSFKDMSQGVFQRTDNYLDFAVEGKGFFVIETDAGNRYTRDGNFTINSDSELVTQSGNYVLDSAGERIQLIPDQDFRVSADGQITFNNGLQGAQIALMNFEDESQLLQQGDNLYAAQEGAVAVETDAGIAQGYLEGSNVKIVEEMAKMIKTTRHYESNQKVISSIDETLNKVINEVGRA